MSRAKALIVDDSATARIMLSRLLEKADYDSDGVSSAEDALRELEQGGAYDLVFLDHLLPGMDGFEALRRIKGDPSTASIPVFMYTSQNAERYLEEARAMGAAGVISKQISRDQLLERLGGIATAEENVASESVPMEDDVQLAYRSGLEKQGMRRLTGRLSTVEAAYEDLHDELRNLRWEQIHKSERELELERRLSRTRWVVAIVVVFLVMATGMVWMQMETVHQTAQELRSQMLVITDIIGNMLESINNQ